MRRFRHSTSTENPSSIDISPLIDVVFLLLIFFIVTTVFVKETGVEISKPRAASSEDLDRQAILIAVTIPSPIRVPFDCCVAASGRSATRRWKNNKIITLI